jgi:hypothetical protein
LTVDSGSYHLVTSSFNLTIALELDRLRPFVSLETSYLLSYSAPEISASFTEYASSGKLKSKGVEIGKLSGFATVGLGYELAKNMLVSLVAAIEVLAATGHFPLVLL